MVTARRNSNLGATLVKELQLVVDLIVVPLPWRRLPSKTADLLKSHSKSTVWVPNRPNPNPPESYVCDVDVESSRRPTPPNDVTTRNKEP